MPNKQPEWDFFKRLEGAEEKIEVTEQTLKDALVLASEALILAFGMMAKEYPSYARLFKDKTIEDLKKGGLSQRRLESIQSDLLWACDLIDKKRR
jgi:hypothetical protein